MGLTEHWGTAARGQVRGDGSTGKREEDWTPRAARRGRKPPSRCCLCTRGLCPGCSWTRWELLQNPSSARGPWWLRTQASEPVVPEFISWVCHFLAVWLWTVDVNDLIFTILICKNGQINNTYLMKLQKLTKTGNGSFLLGVLGRSRECLLPWFSLDCLWGKIKFQCQLKFSPI